MSVSEKTKRGAAWPRRVMPEILDQLSASDPRAARSRRDLRLINRIMGSLSLLLRGLDSVTAYSRVQLIELGCGDGSLMLRLAKSRAGRWPTTNVVLLDKEPAVTDLTVAAINDLGWHAEVVAADVFDWFERWPIDSQAVIFANLFVHHFEGERLARLLEGVASCSRLFVCCEPRRSRAALAGSHLLGLIGCNDVTRNDAVVSTHAGFRDGELSAFWPTARSTRWRVTESAAGVFSHLFVASRE